MVDVHTADDADLFEGDNEDDGDYAHADVDDVVDDSCGVADSLCTVATSGTSVRIISMLPRRASSSMRRHADNACHRARPQLQQHPHYCTRSFG